MNQQRNRGFTIIELMLAMTFVSILLLAIAITTIHISNIYNKGITLRAVNEAGRSVSDSLERTIGASTPFTVTGSPSSYIAVADQGGRLCVGSYSYVWNYAAAFLPAGTPLNTYAGDSTPIRFVRVSDPGASLCASPLAAIDKSRATEFLTAGDRDLLIHQFSITAGASSDADKQALYKISFIIGTSGRNGAIDTSDYHCVPPTVDKSETYCAVNRFDIITRAGNTPGEAG